MKHFQFTWTMCGTCLAVLCGLLAAAFECPALLADDWPPALPGASNGTVTIHTDDFLKIPEAVVAKRGMENEAAFVVAKTAPTIRLAYHTGLGPEPLARRLWSSWGDICVASDGSVYCGIGDHHHDAEGDARCFIYRWNPIAGTLRQIVDMNQVVEPQSGQPAWSKVHAKIDEAADGKIYFSCTLNAGNRAGLPQYQWTDRLPGAQLYQYDPQAGSTTVFASLPKARCTATSLLDRERNLWWCNLEAGDGDALYALNLSNKEVHYQSADGLVVFNRAFALLNDGSVCFNGEGGLRRLEPSTGTVTAQQASLGTSPGIRCATRQSRDGFVYGATHGTGQLYEFHPERDSVTLLGPTWSTGEYTTVMELSPDERFVYYLPGAHGKAWQYGTPVIQYDLRTKQRKVLAFLAPAVEAAVGYVPAGTYGIKLNADGSRLYVNFNGHPTDSLRPGTMKPIGFGLCAFMDIEIPVSER